MGKEIILDEFVRDAFIYGEKTPTMGLLIGAYTEIQEYYVAHLAQTFEESLESKNGGECGSQSGSSSENEGEIQRGEPKSFAVINPVSVSHHAKQAIRMLPGGLLILGIYVIEPIDNIFTSKYETSIKNLVTSLNKSLGRNPHYEADFGTDKEKLVFHFNPSTKKFTSKVINGENFRTTPMTTSFRRLEWAKLESEYDTTAVMHLAKPESGLPLRKNLRILMNTFHGTLEGAKFLINGKYPSDSVIFEEPTIIEENEIEDLSEEEESDYKPKDRKRRPASPLHILIDKTPGILRSRGGGDDFIDHLHLIGKISTMAFVPVGSSTAHVVKMLKQDILRSMASRMEMHCESLIDVDQTHSSDEEDFSSKIVHEVPRRVYSHLPGSKLLVSDYLFPGEGSRDSIVTFRDILSLRLEDASEILSTKEQALDSEENLRAKGSMDELLDKAENMTKLENIGSKRLFLWFTIIGVLTVIIALGIQIMMSRN